MKSTQLNIFQDKFNVRSMTDANNTVWFVAVDVAAALGYSDTKNAVQRHFTNRKPFSEINLPLDDKIQYIWQGFFGHNNWMAVNLVTEKMVYKMLFKSRLSEGHKATRVEQFVDWLFDVVLPSIRGEGEFKDDDFFTLAEVISANGLHCTVGLSEHLQETAIALKECVKSQPILPKHGTETKMFILRYSWRTFKNSKIGSVVVKPTKESCVPHTEQYMELLAQAARADMNGSEEDEFYLI